MSLFSDIIKHYLRYIYDFSVRPYRVGILLSDEVKQDMHVLDLLH